MTAWISLDEAIREPEGSRTAALPSPWVDADAALRQLSGDESAYVEICEIFLHESIQWSARLPRLALQDREGFVSLLHEVTNAMPIVGAQVVGKVLRDRERLLRDESSASVEPVLADVMRGLQQVCAELREQIARRRV